MLLVGLTGGIGSGKSTVAAALAERGAVVVDADLVARQVVGPGTPGLEAVRKRFGPGVFAPDGLLDRAALAAVVFSDPGARRALEAITHPVIAAEMALRVAAHHDTDAVVVLDLPLLGPRGVTGYGLDAVIVVDAPPDVAVARLVGQRGFGEADARARIAAQVERAERRALAGLAPIGAVIDNGGDRLALGEQVARVWGLLVPV